MPTAALRSASLLAAQNLVWQDERRVARCRENLEKAHDHLLLMEKAVDDANEHEQEVENGRVVPDLEAELDSWMEFHGVPGTTEQILPDRLQGVCRDRMLGRAPPAARERVAAAVAPAAASPPRAGPSRRTT